MNTTVLPFTHNAELTFGVELELQLVNLHTFDLAMESADFLRRLNEVEHSGEIKPEITQAMIEINSSIHRTYPTLLAELHTLRDLIATEARKTHIGVAGGGTHAFQKWKAQRIFPTERFNYLSQEYGYLAKQFTVFGQHIHLACKNGDDALYLCHAMARYIPHFIALSAASPFQQGVDTGFDCSRLIAVSAFPLSGTPPWLFNWVEFEDYFAKLVELGLVKTMKDFYWDIRPKPEYGTVELRICDTPLGVDKAAELAAYAQALASWLLDTRPALSADIYLTYPINRFRAMRYGLHATLIEPIAKANVLLVNDVVQTCRQLEPYAANLDSLDALVSLRVAAQMHDNGANWLRERYTQLDCLPDVAKAQTLLWMSPNRE